MIVKLFVLGHPGSGKSTVARYIVDYVKQIQIHKVSRHISDYSILLEMFLDDMRAESDVGDKRFEASAYRGFHVLDPAVYDEALRRLEKRVQLLVSEAVEVIVVEFARVDYREAFNLFSPGFLQNAYFLFLDVEIEICKKRILARVEHPIDHMNDHFVPDEVLELYRQKDNRGYISSLFKKKYCVDDERVLIINNAGNFHDVAELIEQFVEQCLQDENSVLSQ